MVFIGHADSNLLIGMIYLAVVDVVLMLIAYWMFATGYKLKA